jgi:hypothetical protein
MCALVVSLLVTAQVEIETPAAATVEEHISHINMVSPSSTPQEAVRLRMEAVRFAVVPFLAPGLLAVVVSALEI